MIVTIESDEGALRYTKLEDGEWKVQYRMDKKWYVRQPSRASKNQVVLEVQRVMRGDDISPLA